MAATGPGVHLGVLVAGAIGIALVSFADTSVLSRTFAIRGGYRVDPNQELVALGAANEAAGARTEFTLSIVCFLGVAVLGVIEGIFIAIALALLDFIRRAPGAPTTPSWAVSTTSRATTTSSATPTPSASP